MPTNRFAVRITRTTDQLAFNGNSEGRDIPKVGEGSPKQSVIKVAEPQIPWREQAGFRNLFVHSDLGVDHGAVWLVAQQDLPTLTETVNPMTTRLAPQYRSGQAPGRRASGRFWPSL